jgi:ribosome-associated protein
VKNANAKNEKLKNTIIAALEDLKAVDVTVLSVADSSSVTDWMVIATGTSNRHVKALANNVEVDGKKQGFKPIGSEGNETAEWVLVDFGDVIVHVMLPTTRAFYDLESLWTLKPAVID